MTINLFTIEKDNATLGKEFKQQIIDALNDDRLVIVEATHKPGQMYSSGDPCHPPEFCTIRGQETNTMRVVLLDSPDKPMCGRIEMLITVKG